VELQTYIPAGLAIVMALAFCGVFVALAVLFGPPRRPYSAAKLSPFECGSEPIGTPRARHSVKFYQVAILFLVFDIESAFMYPWAVMYSDLSQGQGGGVSVFGFVEMLIFVAVLVAALAYVWRKKAIGWD
jgi:NADH-quinone oxidoreductase subunit A